MDLLIKEVSKSTVAQQIQRARVGTGRERVIQAVEQHVAAERAGADAAGEYQTEIENDAVLGGVVRIGRPRRT